jgi:anaerobic magnesium-protoporphyrin IX monomethyl ester cyclase
MDIARFREARKEFPPFGVLYLAAVLEGAGHSVNVESITPDSCNRDLTQYELVGVSIASSATYNLVRRFIDQSIRDPDTPILLGGVHCLFYAEMTLEDFPEAVAVAYGESESIICELVVAACTGDVSHVPGIVRRDSNGAVTRNAPPTAEVDINELPFPARHLLPPSDIVMTDRLPAVGDITMAHVLFSRGCPFPCAFCAAGNTSARYRSGASAVEELRALVDRYGIEGFAIVEDNFIVRKRAVSEICKAIKPLGLKWSALSRIDTVNKQLLATMAESGCVEIKYGIESGSESLLRKMKKNTTRERIRRSVIETNEVGIAVKAFIIHGFPGENLETTTDTISLLEELRHYIQRISLFRFVPLPGTEAYNKADYYGIRPTHRDLSGWDGDWSRYHIHHNDFHWWGTDEEFAEMQTSFELLESYIGSNFLP